MTEASETLPTTDVKKRPWNAMDITTWSSVFPLSSVCMVIVLVLVRPDHAREALDTWSKHFKMTPAVFIGTTFLSAVGLMIVCLFSMWAILAIFYGIKEYYANKEGMKKERAALIEFFEALGGNGWKDKTRWCSEEPLGRWKGIKVDHNNGRVNKIILPSNRLEGSFNIHRHFETFFFLTLWSCPFFLSNICPSGEIPGHIFRDLPFLREIDLRENSIRGSNLTPAC